ncbi:MAG TPA: DedA family protein [Acetobacteraceae bacterium]|nr:DedA family protein [Acetobacteraceae bacterium]
MIADVAHAVLAWMQQHEAWAPAVVFALAFGESLAVISLLLPATVILLGAGGLIGAAGLSFWPVWTAAVAGAVLGDAVSYWVAYHFQDAVGRIWPLSRHPDLLPRGHAFFQRWGTASVFLGRFFGPLRSVVPLVAGLCGMPHLMFQFANVTSALAWATLILAPGVFGARWLL